MQEGVWLGLSLLMLGRLATLVWRYNTPGGPVPPASPAGISASPGAGENSRTEEEQY